MRIIPAEPGQLGAHVEGLDLRTVDRGLVEELLALTYREKLVVFRDQSMNEAEYLDMARRFGRPQVYFQSHYHHPKHPEIFVSSNIPENGQKVGVAGTGRFWHTDYQFFDEPLSLTFVYPQVLPRSRRETSFIDMGLVWRTLPEALRRPIEGRNAFHEATWYYKVQPADIDRAIIDLVREFRKLSPGATHPAVITHPVTGEKFLYVSEGFTTAIVGLTHEENERLLPELFAFVGRPEHMRTHVWREGDVMFWDNRGLIHRAGTSMPGEPSKSYRIGVYDSLPFYVEALPSSAGSRRS